MQIWKRNDSSSISGPSLKPLKNRSAGSCRTQVRELLDVEVIPGKMGLQVLSIGEESPLCRLKPLGSFTMHGLVEQGDQIVAIDGVLLRSPADLISLLKQTQCEVTIFDHRTRLTVSWQIHVREMLEIA